MGSGGLRGPQNRCEACKTSWMCSIHIRSRHTLPALLCSRSCCVPQRRCFVFARAFRSAAISAAVFSFVHRVSSMPMEVFCRMTTVRRADLSCVVQAGGLSSRMGCDKARMAFCGEPLIERVLGRLAPVAGELVVTTSRPSELAYLEELMFGGLRAARGGGRRRVPRVPCAASRARWPRPDCRSWRSSPAICRLSRRNSSARLPIVLRPRRSTCACRARSGGLSRFAPSGAVTRVRRLPKSCSPDDRQRIRCLIDRVQAGYMDEPQIVEVAGSTLCFENVNTPEEFAAAELLA